MLIAKLLNFHLESLFQLRKAGEIYWLHLPLVVPVMIALNEKNGSSPD
jgi:hypothetical protein